MKKNYKVGDCVEFSLDGRWQGKGEIVRFERDEVCRFPVIQLSEPCKEFPANTDIAVDFSEIR